MSTMTSFCRITGHARNLPKPCYFPLLPPISPADAKKLCRITGHAAIHHNYSPIIAYGKPIKFNGVTGCRITQYEDFSYLKPVSFKGKSDKSVHFYKELISNIQNRKKKRVSMDNSYMYKVGDSPKCVILPPELEEAISIGEIETLGLSDNNEHISIKCKQGRIIKIQMESAVRSELEELEIHYGEGQDKAVLEKQMKKLEERKKKKQETLAKRKLFEDKEKRAEEDYQKSTERPPFKKPRVIFDPEKKKEKLRKMQEHMTESKENKSILPPKMITKSDEENYITYEKMFSDVKTAQAYAVKLNYFGSKEFNFSEIERAETEGFDWGTYEDEEKIDPVEITPKHKNPTALKDSNILAAVDVVASVETVEPSPKVPKSLLRSVSTMEVDKLQKTKNALNILQETEVNIIPSEKNIIDIIEVSPESTEFGCLVRNKEGKPEFISRKDVNKNNKDGLSGAMVHVQSELKFVPGQIIKLAEQESFVAGQTLETNEGSVFVPGQTVINDDGNITFIPGTSVTNEENNSQFVCGRVVEHAGEHKFVPGQITQREDELEKFTPGQTILTSEGLKFIPGEVLSDEEGNVEFVPGINISKEDKDEFIPGQVFMSDEGLKITPGQIVHTEEGPSFIQGISFKKDKNEKVFIKGKNIVTEDGNVMFEKDSVPMDVEREDLLIKNRDLHLIADANGEVTGFKVNPLNTIDLQPGDALYGDIVESPESVLFYLTGKCPQDLIENTKIISGQLKVTETAQKFIPGKIISSPEGDKFIPGQVVMTASGEEFVPGKIVETNEGPKFIPGQVISTSDGDKFIPGQVIAETDGPRFVPGQIIETEHGATFIPGQMMNTDDGRKFVPGQLIETKEGPRFVPGQVVETHDGPKFLPGIVVETEDGLKYVPSETGEEDDDMEISFQGFDITPEELLLLSTVVDESNRQTPVTGEHGLIDSSTLKKLSTDFITVHGRTPEPMSQGSKPFSFSNEGSKAKKSKSTVAFNAPYDSSEDEFEDIEDVGTDKIDVLKHLLASQSTVSNNKKDKEIKAILSIINPTDETMDEGVSPLSLAISYILTSDRSDNILQTYFEDEDRLIEEILSSIRDIENMSTNSEAKKLIENIVKSIVTKRCNETIDKLVDKLTDNPDMLFVDQEAQMLLAEAVGIVCVTGDIEAAALLEQFISQPDEPSCLKDNAHVLEVLRQLTVLHEVAKKDPRIDKVLTNLRIDPNNVSDHEEVFRLMKLTKMLLRKDQQMPTAFNVRHIASSKDIPAEIFQQLKDDKLEAEKFIEDLPDELFYAIMGDNRCGEKLLDSISTNNKYNAAKEIEKFRKGMAIVVAKEHMQAVIPRHYARSVCYGIIPYLLIDEDGFKFFERGLTGRKLAPSKVIENTWYDAANRYRRDSTLYSQLGGDGLQYSLILPGKGNGLSSPYYQYTSLLPSSGPTKLSYLESRRSSREGSITPFRMRSRSATPSRRSSVNSVNDYYVTVPSVQESYSRRGSATSSLSGLPPKTNGSLISPLALNSYPHKEITVDSDEDEIDDNSRAVVPYCADGEEEPEIRRSDTVAKLLDKYSNFSVEKEFARPLLSSQKLKMNGTIENEDSDSDENARFPLGGNRSRSLSTPERGYKLRTDMNLNNVAPKVRSRSNDKRRLMRPFSDIFEVDELESPTCNKTIVNGDHLEYKGKNRNQSNDIESILSQRPGDHQKKSKKKNKSKKKMIRQSEPRALYSDEPTYRRSRHLPSRSEDRDIGYSGRNSYLDDELLYKGKEQPKTNDKRYKHIDDPRYNDYSTSYNAKPYSNYLDYDDGSEDEEERPSYQLLGRNVRQPYKPGSYANNSYLSNPPAYSGGYYGNGYRGNQYSDYITPVPAYFSPMPPAYGSGDSAYRKNSACHSGMSSYGYDRSSLGRDRDYGSDYRTPLRTDRDYGSDYRTPMSTDREYGSDYRTPVRTGRDYGYSFRNPLGENREDSYLSRRGYSGANTERSGSVAPRTYQRASTAPLLERIMPPSRCGYGGYGNSYDVDKALSPAAKPASRHSSKKDKGLRQSRPISPSVSISSKYTDNLNDSDDDLRLRIPKIKKFDASKYLDNSPFSDDEFPANNDGNDDSDLSSEQFQDNRKLASDLAKKYMRSFSLDDKEEVNKSEEDEE